MATSLEFGLDQVAGDPNLTFIFFIALVLLTAISVRFGLYAYWNLDATDLPGQRAIWRSLVYVGTVATLYGLVGLLDIMSTLTLPFNQALMVGFVLLLAITFRRIYFTATASASGVLPEGGLVPGRQAIESGFVLVVIVLLVGMGLLGMHPYLIALQGVSAVVVTIYGLYFSNKQTSESRVQGTTIDTLVRHLLSVLLFGMMVPFLDLVILTGIERVVILHVRVVFLIVVATSLMTATIKLKQNLASM